MSRDFSQNDWGLAVEHDLEKLLEIAGTEDLDMSGDLTSRVLIPADAKGSATIRLREDGVVAGMPSVPTVLKSVDAALVWRPEARDGDRLAKGDRVGVLTGPARGLLTVERQVLNLLGRLSGIATLTARYVDRVAGTGARIYDTRKTTLGWRRLEKYAVRCGGGFNHRTGLFDAILIKDNHLAFGEEGRFLPPDAVNRAKEFVSRLQAFQDQPSSQGAGGFSSGRFKVPDVPIVEIEVDTLEQLKAVLPAGPDIVLLDNMNPETLAEAVRLRNALNPVVELEASGGITLSTVRAVAESGVERISVGALTHSAVSIDLGLDWGP